MRLQCDFQVFLQYALQICPCSGSPLAGSRFQTCLRLMKCIEVGIRASEAGRVKQMLTQ